MKIGRFTAVFKQSRQDGRANRDNAANRKKQRKDTKFNAMGTEVKLKTYPRSRSYKVRTKFVFEGTFEVKADSRQMAIQIVKSQCGMKQQGATIAVTTDDSPAMAKIKRFMALYGIIDIKMRMLRIPELKRIMGFPSDYVLVGTQADQKKFIGNAVEVNMARVLCEALCTQLIKNNIAA